MRTASFSSSVFPSLANLRQLLLVALLALGLAACGQQKPTFQNIDVTGGSEFGKDFKLTDHTGKQRTLADFKGKAVVMFFGYTHCPDVCPTTMVEWKTVMEQLGPDADRVQVLFITVDPERDTQALLAQYVPAFDPRFLGMRPADEAALRQLTKDFKVFYAKVPGSSPGNYTVDHSAGSYVFDPEGRLRLFIRHGQGTEPIVKDMKQLLS
ncbi:SCO family protein [Cupriavidus gilardii]|uniref:SCO family protein n=1 Tax=Cupriavidus gilardii TaxID=82541 RepID=A0A6N1BGI0_9BURK|nr:SCO family protein [Cupriavidus gilardii]ALD89531.1 cytochrome C oxidase assembly factor, scoc [Cupriavidus gilardii CR3]QQE07172.1 SCO family protein [Cupriavidus sp. ISTL7]KAB0595143.1 SCO family protein [Cupriavidus gilardii]MCT9017001.1 SCO family protein [Cupriavidus gilardii]MCT9056622.1 SCO family protein [Cupriavidus gilardii]